MITVKASDTPGPDLEALPFGMKVRYSRVHIKMSSEYYGILYAQAIGRKKPYTGRRMEQMELHDGFPKDKTRRWAIAKIVQMGLFFNLSSLGIDPPFPQTTLFAPGQSGKMKLDINDHQVFLRQSWTQGFRGTLKEAEEEIIDRIYDIYDKAPYLSDKQKTQAWRTLGGYHILLATEIYAGQNNVAAVTKHTNMAGLLAKENNYPDLHALALLQRGVFLRTQENFTDALHALQATRELKRIPQQLQGKILAETARVKASMALKQADVDEALRLLDEAEGMIDKGTLDDFDYFVAFDENKYRLDRGEALVGSSVKGLRSPETALSYLPVVYRVGEVPKKEPFQTIGHRQAHNHIVQAAIHIDQEMYTVAITLAEEALAFVERVHSKVYLKKLVQLYEALKNSPYGNSIEVTMLEIGIMRNLHPELFN